jgi:thiamine phosphate synthase YjbQ (UPF0047 family)
MKSYRKELWFNLPSRRGFVNITPDVETCLRESGVKGGLVLCNAMHISDGRLSTRTNAVVVSRLKHRRFRLSRPLGNPCLI